LDKPVQFKLIYNIKSALSEKLFSKTTLIDNCIIINAQNKGISYYNVDKAASQYRAPLRKRNANHKQSMPYVAVAALSEQSNCRTVKLA